MNLPNGDRAIIPIEKLLGYCLNPEHSKGKHKARVFKSALGITAENVDELIRLIRQAAIEGVVVQELETAFGREFKLDWTISGTDAIELRTIWMLSQGSIDPQFVSAFIK